MILTQNQNRKLQRKIWSILTNYHYKKKVLQKDYSSLKNKKSMYYSEIVNDIERTPISDKKFIDKIKVALIDLLNRYAIYNQNVGYVQGMNYLVSSLYVYFKSKQDTFWVLHSLMTDYKLEELYNSGLNRLKNLFDIVNLAVEKYHPNAHLHFLNTCTSPELYVTQYIMT